MICLFDIFVGLLTITSVILTWSLAVTAKRADEKMDELLKNEYFNEDEW